jgi:hypothetical protein
MVAENLPEAVLAGGGKRIGTALARMDRGYAASLAGRVITALGLASGVWIAAIVAPAAIGGLVLGLVQWVGVLVLAVLGSGIRVPLSVMPHALAQLTAVWPVFHVDQLVRYAAGSAGIGLLPHVTGVAAMAAVFFVMARRGLREVR